LTPPAIKHSSIDVRLCSDFGVTGTCLHCIASYLSEFSSSVCRPTRQFHVIRVCVCYTSHFSVSRGSVRHPSVDDWSMVARQTYCQHSLRRQTLLLVGSVLVLGLTVWNTLPSHALLTALLLRRSSRFICSQDICSWFALSAPLLPIPCHLRVINSLLTETKQPISSESGPSAVRPT